MKIFTQIYVFETVTNKMILLFFNTILTKNIHILGLKYFADLLCEF
jgi:hypothetical protein